ncbi:MAG: hypothetical protein V3T49_00175, partial [Dehalococcoidia bacterium]
KHRHPDLAGGILGDGDVSGRSRARHGALLVDDWRHQCPNSLRYASVGMTRRKAVGGEHNFPSAAEGSRCQ